MRRITTAMSALVGLLALSVAFVGSAQAHTFEWSGANAALLLVLADGPQTFTAAPGLVVICKHVRLDGTVKQGAQLNATARGTYTGCEAAGLKAVVSEAEYEFSADETVSVINKTIAITVAALGCEVTVGPSNNKELKKVRYLEDPKSGGTRILAHVEVAGINSTTKGTCGVEEGAHAGGTYFGLVLAFAHGTGTLKWS